MSTFVERLIQNSKRREQVSKAMTPCPVCGTKQVQLVAWLTETPAWKCRRCKARWTINLPWNRGES